MRLPGMAPGGHGGVDDDVQSYRPLKATSEGVWQGDNPLHFSLPLLILQICLVHAVTRGLAFGFRRSASRGSSPRSSK
ncbi:cation/H(+) antiporter 17 [Triticum aestivum]|uniref:cation/H(+) antiporter 17 n=1 Tax=Triticum aestivum TaxID=4565 RepID=UPI001D00B2AD|nr:cation/H(+) antiporter 17-like [Triticum aestivum]